MLLELKGAMHIQRVEVSPKGEMVYFAMSVDCVFLMLASLYSIFLQKPITLGILLI